MAGIFPDTYASACVGMSLLPVSTISVCLSLGLLPAPSSARLFGGGGGNTFPSLSWSWRTGGRLLCLLSPSVCLLHACFPLLCVCQLGNDPLSSTCIFHSFQLGNQLIAPKIFLFLFVLCSVSLHFGTFSLSSLSFTIVGGGVKHACDTTCLHHTASLPFLALPTSCLPSPSIPFPFCPHTYRAHLCLLWPIEERFCARSSSNFLELLPSTIPHHSKFCLFVLSSCYSVFLHFSCTLGGPLALAGSSAVWRPGKDTCLLHCSTPLGTYLLCTPHHLVVGFRFCLSSPCLHSGSLYVPPASCHWVGQPPSPSPRQGPASPAAMHHVFPGTLSLCAWH